MQTSDKASGRRCPGNCFERNLPLSGHAVRFRVSTTEKFTDQIMGRFSEYLPGITGDFVVRRRDGLFTYQLASVTDDAADGITQIVRGADLLDNTPRQIALFRALGVRIPEFLHLPVAANESGQKLSKQSGARPVNPAQALQNLRAAWQLLGQPPLVQYRDLKSFWASAIAAWNPGLIPACPQVSAPADMY